MFGRLSCWPRAACRGEETGREVSEQTQSTPGRSPKVFISYRRDDAASAAGRLRERMVPHFAPDNIFMDIDTIDLGADVRGTIRAAVMDSDVLIAVIGRHWLDARDKKGRRRLKDKDDWVRFEIATALGAGLVVIPVLVDGAELPAATALPRDVAPLLERNGFEIRTDRFVADVSQFLDEVVAAARRAAEARSVNAPPRAETPRAVTDVAMPSSRWRTLILVGCMVALAAIVLLIRGIIRLRPDGRTMLPTHDPLLVDAQQDTAISPVDADIDSPALPPPIHDASDDATAVLSSHSARRHAVDSGLDASSWCRGVRVTRYSRATAVEFRYDCPDEACSGALRFEPVDTKRTESEILQNYWERRGPCGS